MTKRVPKKYVESGDEHRSKGDYYRAIADYDQAIRLDPTIRGRLYLPRRRL